MKENDKQKKGRPQNNQAQNKQVNDAATQVTLSTDKELRQRFRDIIHERSRKNGENLGYVELLNLANQVKKREIY